MRYRSDWEWLGIAPTTDIPTIKRAFAAKTREYHPEEYPEEFMALQKAYKSAIAYAKASKERQKQEEQGYQEHREDGVTLMIPKFEQDAHWDDEMTQPLPWNIISEKAQSGGEKEKEPENITVANGERQPVGESALEKQKTQDEEQKSIGQQDVKEDGIRQESVWQEIFDYGEIARQEQEQTERRFFLGFAAIAENSCICNNEKIWRTFLRIEEFQPYFEQEDFCRRLLDVIVQRSYLPEEIVRVFIEKLEHNDILAAALSGDGSGPAAKLCLSDQKFAKAVKKLKRRAKRRIHLPKVARHSKEMTDFHQIVLRKARLGGRSADITTWQGAAEYLDVYLPYAMEYLEQIRKTGQSSRRAARIVNVIFGLGCLMIVIAAVVNIWVLPYMERNDKTPVLQRQFEENMGQDSLFDDNLAPDSDGDVYLEDMEEVMEDMLERYENWQK